jgi:hypothetical protein
LLGDSGERIPAPVGVVVFDRFAQALQVGTDQLGERDQQRVVDAGEVHESFPEVVERTVRQTGEVRNRLSGELSDVSAGELILGGPAVLTAAALGLAA